MAYWRHRNQRGGYISLAHRRRTQIRWDGIFEAPDTPETEALLKAAGHKRVEGKPGKDASSPPSHQTQTEVRIEARRLTRQQAAQNARGLAGAAHGVPHKSTDATSAPAVPAVPKTKDEALRLLQGIAKKNGVAAGGTFEELEARLKAAGLLEAKAA